MAKPTTPKRKCGSCGKVVEARMIQSARLEWDNLKTIVFHKTAPVFICAICDTAPPSGGMTPPATYR